MSLRSRGVAVPLAFLIGCASSPAPVAEPESALEVAQRRLRELAAREAGPRPIQVVASPDGAFTATVPASPAAPVEIIERSYRLRLDIGTDSSVDCYVSPEALDLANSLIRFNDTTAKEAETRVGGVHERTIELVDAGAFGDAGFVAMSWIYRMGDPARPVVGHLKQRIASKGERSYYCQHFEVGYHETFREVFEALVESSDFPGGAAPRPFYTRIVKATIAERLVGLQRTTALRDSKGNEQIKTVSSMVTRVGNSSAGARDAYTVEIADPNGELIRQIHAATRDDELTRQLRLDVSPEGAQVRGRADSQELDTTLTPSAPLRSSLAQRRALRDALVDRGAGARLAYEIWAPEGDPSALATRTIEAYEALDDGAFKVRSRTGDVETDAIIETGGSTRTAEVKRGEAVMKLERIYLDGEL